MKFQLSKSKVYFFASLVFTISLGLGLFFIILPGLWPQSVAEVSALNVSVTAEVSGGACGDGNLDSGETCDGSAGSGNCYNNTCKSDCTCPVCGNGSLEAGEACEQNSDCSTGQTCNGSCQCQSSPPVCIPSTTVCTLVGACVNNQQARTCTNGCSVTNDTVACGVSVCGNNVVETGEQCDDASACCTGSCQTTGTILNVSEAVAKNSAVIGWQTQSWGSASCQPTSSTSLIEWGRDTNYTEGSANLSGSIYSFNITSLLENTQYFYRIRATLPSGQVTYNDSFITTVEVEDCNNGVDDDSDGLIDIADNDCPCTAQWVCDVDDVNDAQCIANQKVKTCTQEPTDACWDTSSDPSEAIGCNECTGVVCPAGQTIIDQNTCECGIQLGVCGNGLCEPNATPSENEVSCPQDCQVSCISQWDCQPWEPSQCPANGIQTRSCTDSNNCTVPTNPPQQTQTCGGICPGLTCSIGQKINTQLCTCENIIPFCGNGVCESSESQATCAADCIALCEPAWTCSAWGPCVSNLQYRTCDDLNSCNLNLNNPPEVRACGGVCDNLACGYGQKIDLVNCQCITLNNFCGNGVCEGSEKTWSCPVDCGLPPTYRFTLTACLDGKDNDGDGSVDYPADTGCTKPSDRSELNVAEVLENIQDFITDNILDNQAVEQANQVVAPTVVAVVAVNTFASFSLFNFLSYVRYLFTQPFAVLWRRKRKKYGIVYNALTRRPIDLAIVRLYDKASGRIVQSRVTDKNGRYLFIAQPGQYYMTVTKPKHDFPSQYLKDKKEDINYLDLYHGETLAVTEKNGVITANIPVDPQIQERPARKVVIQYYLRKLQFIASFSAVPLAALSAVISPGPLTLSLLGFHTLLFVLFRRLGYQKPPKSWGVVYDKDTKKPLGRAIARIYDKKYNKLLESRVTDNKGRYSFLVNENIYYVTTEKLGYAKSQTNEIDLVSKKKDEVVNMDIGMNKADKVTAGTTTPMPQPTPVVAPTPAPAEPVQTAEPKSLSPEDVSQVLKKPQPAVPDLPHKPSITENQIEEKVDELVVGRGSLEEIIKNKKDIAEIKEEIEHRKEQLDELEEKVEELEEKIEEKPVETTSAASQQEGKPTEDKKDDDNSAASGPVKSIFG